MANYTITNEVDIKNSTSGGIVNLFPPGSANAVSLITPPPLSSNINFNLPNNSGSNGNFLRVTSPGNFSWVTPTSVVTNAFLPYNVCYSQASSGSDLPAIGRSLPATASTVRLTGFIFMGTSVTTPKKCSVITTSNISGMIIRIINKTNSSNLICSITIPLTGSPGTPALSSTTTFTNLPSGLSVFEIQAIAPSNNISSIYNLLLE